MRGSPPSFVLLLHSGKSLCLFSPRSLCPEPGWGWALPGLVPCRSEHGPVAASWRGPLCSYGVNGAPRKPGRKGEGSRCRLWRERGARGRGSRCLSGRARHGVRERRQGPGPGPGPSPGTPGLARAGLGATAGVTSRGQGSWCAGSAPRPSRSWRANTRAC